MASYNGWANRETWAMFTWFGEELSAVPWEATASNPIEARAKALEAWAYALQQDMLEAPDRQVLLALFDIGSLDRVDWAEIAEAL